LLAKEYTKEPLGIIVKEHISSEFTKPGIYVFTVCVEKTSDVGTCYGGIQEVNVRVM
jgi:hypothetical protein